MKEEKGNAEKRNCYEKKEQRDIAKRKKKNATQIMLTCPGSAAA